MPTATYTTAEYVFFVNLITPSLPLSNITRTEQLMARNDYSFGKKYHSTDKSSRERMILEKKWQYLI